MSRKPRNFQDGYSYHITTRCNNREFKIDDYLELCKEKEIEPEKPFKGSFNIRLGTELHRRATIEAQQKGINLNSHLAPVR